MTDAQPTPIPAAGLMGADSVRGAAGGSGRHGAVALRCGERSISVREPAGAGVRVIAGTAKGRRLRAAPGMAVRPTADRVKEALFSMLGSRFDLAAGDLLDLFAGTGALGIEGLSRGAPRCVFVEVEGAALRVLDANLDACGVRQSAQVLPRSVPRALRELAARRARFAGVVLDPPYRKGLAAQTLAKLGEGELLASGAWVAVEHHADDLLEPSYGCLRLTAARRYGKTCLALYTSSQMAEQVAVS